MIRRCCPAVPNASTRASAAAPIQATHAISMTLAVVDRVFAYLPLSADQPWIAKRCAEIGVGIVCATDEIEVGDQRVAIHKSSKFQRATLRQAVRALLEDIGYRERAQGVQVKIAELPPTENAAEWIEALTKAEAR